MSQIRLNIGAGQSKFDGFIPLDIKNGHSATALDYAAGSVAEIRASHVLEHLDYAGARCAIGEWNRVLEDGGVLTVCVPDMRRIDFKNPLWRFHVMGGQTDEHDYHKSAWDDATLKELLSSQGFHDFESVPGDPRDTSILPVSLNLRCVKAKPVPTSGEIKIAAVCSIPRLGWNDHWGCTIDALRKFSIPVRRFTGAYWGQCMQNVLEDCVADNLDWVLTLDYDTMFTSKHLDRMFGHFGSNPQIDALAPLQCRRGGDTALMTIRGQTKTEVTPQPIRVNTAHFGCTLIRCDALREIPKPWFWSTPGADGSWSKDDPGKLDDDIYFWDRWAKHGKTVYVAPDVVVGHLELMVAEFDDNMNAVHTRVNDWWSREKGKQ